MSGAAAGGVRLDAQRADGGLDPEALYFTATRRQVHAYLEWHARAELKAGRRVWRTPTVLPADTALATAYSALDGTRAAVLPRAAALRLWRTVIEADAGGAALLDTRAAASAAARAYALVAAYRIELAAGAPRSLDQAAFLDWTRAYEATLHERGYIDRASVCRELMAVPVSPGEAPVRLLTPAPDPPAQAALYEHWRRGGRDVRHALTTAARTQPTVRVYRTRDEEWDALTDWALDFLRTRPEARLAVLWPGLRDEELERRRRLDAALFPAALVQGCAPERPYAVGVSPPLAAQGVVAAALMLLEFAAPAIDWTRLGRLLRSPYVAGADSEARARATLDANLRRRHTVRFASEDLARLLGDVPEFAQARRRLLETLGGAARRPLTEWAGVLGAALAAAGWPGPRPLASNEHQAVEKFREALAELASLSVVLGAQSLAVALGELQEIAATLEFQPEAGSAQVVFLDGPALLGFPVDGLWVAGLDSTRLPAAAPPEPLVPLSLQRAAGVPAAAVGAARRAADAALADWQAMAGRLVLSMAETEAGEPRRPSPLLPAAAERSGPVTPLRLGYARLQRAQARLEPAPLPRLPALRPDAPITGGAGTLDAQSACPFRAAVEARLKVRGLDSPAGGVGAEVRGTLAHAALTEVWRELGDRATLLKASPEALGALIRRAVGHAFARHRHSAPRGRLGIIEQAWLEASIAGLLDADRARPDFKVVLTEAERELDLCGHRLTVRIDRLDQTSDGRYVLIDYKTGQPNIAGWQHERLRDVQLPLYAAHLAEAPAAVAVAALGPRASVYRGLTSHGHEFGKLSTAGQDAEAYQAQVGRWRAQTLALARAFIDGHAAVDPATDACRYCTHAPLCRIPTDPSDQDPDEPLASAAGSAADEAGDPGSDRDEGSAAGSDRGGARA